VVAGLAVGGKVIGATIGTFLVGEGGRRSIEVGTGLAQPGEFSLAMAKAGAEHRSVGAGLYPAVVIGTVFASVLYPLVFRSAALIDEILATYAPGRWRGWSRRATVRLNRIYSQAAAGGNRLSRVAGLLRVTFVNVGVIFLLIALGGGLAAAIVSFGQSFAVNTGPAHIILAAVVITLAVAPGIVVWKAISQTLAEIAPWLREAGVASRKRLLYELTQRSAVAVALVGGAVLSAPWVLSLMRVGELRSPVQLLAAAVAAAVAASVALKIHSALESTFHLTLLGEGAREPDGDQRQDH
jgi:CPA2 family monovalent cation:H+ antiporter-2